MKNGPTQLITTKPKMLRHMIDTPNLTQYSKGDGGEGEGRVASGSESWRGILKFTSSSPPLSSLTL